MRLVRLAALATLTLALLTAPAGAVAQATKIPRPEHHQNAPGHGELRRSDPQGRQARRPAD